MTSHTTESLPLVNSAILVPLVPASSFTVHCSENLELPLLTPAASYIAVSSLTTQHRPVMPLVPDARSLYNTSSVNHFVPQKPLPYTSASVGGYHVTQQFATSHLPKLTLPTFSVTC